MSRLKERTSRTHIPAPRAAAPPDRSTALAAKATAAGSPGAPEGRGHHRLAFGVAALLAATAVIWGASTLGEDTAPQAPGPATEFQYRPMAGGVPVGP